MSDPSPFQFSILRLGAATTLAAIPFGLQAAGVFNHLGLTCAVSGVLAAIAMLVDRRGVKPIINILLGGTFGFIFMLLLAPAEANTRALRSDVHVIKDWQITGCLVGCVLGLFWNVYVAVTEKE